MRVAKVKLPVNVHHSNLVRRQSLSQGETGRLGRSLTLGFLELVDEERDGVFGSVDDESAHHVFKDLVESLLLDVLLAAALEVNLLLFQHHGCLLDAC